MGDGKITHPPTGRSLSYADLAGVENGGRPTELWSNDAPVTPPERWTIAGKAISRIDGHDFVTGRHLYTPDLTRPEGRRTKALAGAVLRPPRFNAAPGIA